MSLETLLIAKPGLTKGIGWAFIVVFGIGAALFGWKYLEYAAEPARLTAAEAVAAVSSGADDRWVALSDVDPRAGETFQRGEYTTIAFVQSELVVVLAYKEEDTPLSDEEPSGGFGPVSPARDRYLRKQAPELFPEGRPIYELTTWSGPSNMLAGIALMGGFMAFGPMFLFLGWRARVQAERVRREGFDWIDSTREARLVGSGFLVMLGLLAIWLPVQAAGLWVLVVPLAALNLWAPRWLIDSYDDMTKSALSQGTGIPWTPPERPSLLARWRARRAES